MTTILSDYLGEIAGIRGTRAGTGEVSYYNALARALNAAGERLKPRVFCVPNLSSRAGFPDMGLFVAGRGEPLDDGPEKRQPERGEVEVDDIPADISVKQKSLQVRDYLAAHHLVLVTNYRDFVLLGQDGRGAGARAVQLRVRRCRRVLRAGRWHAAAERARQAVRCSLVLLGEDTPVV